MRQSPKWHRLALLVAVSLTTGCATVRHYAVRRELARLVEDLPEPPNSVLLSRAEKVTAGADPHCDGYLISRLYGTNGPMDQIIEFVKVEILVQDGWIALTHRLDRPTTGSIGLRHEKGYRLSVSEKDLTREVLESPLFDHKDVALEQPYSTIFQFNVVHSDPLYLQHCLP